MTDTNITGQERRTGLYIDALGNGDLQLSFCFEDAKRAIITCIPKRQARAIANRILQEIAYSEGRHGRRPGTPHIHYVDRTVRSEAFLKLIGAI